MSKKHNEDSFTYAQYWAGTLMAFIIGVLTGLALAGFFL